MKKLVLVLGILLFGSSISTMAYAGSLNEYEKQVISAAEGEFEEDGVKYKLDSSYVNQLISYLSSDEVDLTQEQMDQVLATMNDYVETGVEQGYLVPLDGQEKSADSEMENASKDKQDEKQKNEQADVQEDTASETVSPSDTEPEEQSKEENQPTEDVQADKEAAASSDQISDGEITNPEKATANTQVQKKQDKELAPEDNAVLQEPSQTENAAEDGIIKNTGFNFNRTVIIIIGMGLLMLICMFVTYRNHFFARSNE